jgi:aminopeptidase N
MSRRPVALAAAAACGLLLVALPVTSNAMAQGRGGTPTPGSPGLGDRLYPKLGNGGYDALHYDLDLRYATSKPTQSVTGTVTLSAKATQALSSFNLDFSGKSVGGVTVDGHAATFSLKSGELRITPAKPIADGTKFTVQVKKFVAKPTKPADTDASVAFFITSEGSATAGQPDAMHYFYPSNDHPSDKATFLFRIDVPKGETAVANGDPTGKKSTKTRTLWTYRERQPMATELTQVAVGKLTVVNRAPVNGVAVRDVVPTKQLAKYKKLLAVESSHLTWMEKQVGPYPFGRYGSLVVTAPDLGFALETQTLSLFDTTWFGLPKGSWSPAMLHELAHQWFGDSVAPKTWSDIWLNEGHASWYEFNYAAQNGYLAEDERRWSQPDLTGLMKQLYQVGDQTRHDDGPVALPADADHVFADNVYEGGALVLYALRQQIGAKKFQAVERSWVTTYQGRSASTADFIALASKVSGQDLTTFLGDWLYGTTTPPMPGHPAWKPKPVVSSAVKTAAVPQVPRR